MKGLRGCLLALCAAALSAVSNAAPQQIADTILILARSQNDADAASSGLQGYGIPFEVLIVPQAGVTLPTLGTETRGNYAGFITVSELAYEYPTGWASAITSAQWQQIYDYQLASGVRMVRIDAWPQADFGTRVAIGSDGCCNGVEQTVKLTNDTLFKSANLKMNAPVSTLGLWHVPAVITNTTTTTRIAAFAPSGQWTTETVAGVVNNFGGRQQMVWFMTWATSWALGPNYLQHANIHFLTRGLFAGARKTHLSTQVDDVHLSTELYEPAGTSFRLRPGDLAAHRTWQVNLNGRLPAGSSFFVELAHNGAGDLAAAEAVDTRNICVPDTYTLIDSYPPNTPLEFVKPLGTGINYWNPAYTNYNWTRQCAALDPLASWLMTASNRDAFAHVSHTYTHLYLNNATYSDASKEIVFNRAWMAQAGISNSAKYSTGGLVPPNISGMHNGDVIRAWMDNGVLYVVGDNSRPLLRNSQSKYWPRITTVADDGHAGLVTIPRWPTTIYYNCDFADCTLHEWINTSAGSGDFATGLLTDARNTNVRYLLGLHSDPFMFHQANMRQTDAPTFTVGTRTARMSLLQIWVETIAQEMTRLTNWPIRTLKHDDVAKFFLNRMTREYVLSPPSAWKTVCVRSEIGC
jgi:hypothetical protein